MSISIDKAIKTRWTAKGLSSVVTGGIHHAVVPPQVNMPYAIYQAVSDTPIGASRASRYNRKLIQIDVYDVSPDLVGGYADTIRSALVNSDKAGSNPLSIPTGSGNVVRIEPDGNPVVRQESDEVFVCTQTLALEWAESRNLQPVS